jgi:hypothetical protein
VFKLSDILTRFEDLLFRKSGFYSIKLKKSSFFLDKTWKKEYCFGEPCLGDRYYKLALDDKYVIFDRILNGDELQKYANEKLPFWEVSWKNFDPKNFWEIARGWQWLPAIIKAKEVNNTQGVINKIICWLDKNHYPNGIAWSIGLDVAIRAINLFIIYQITQEKSLLKYLHEHFVYLEKMIYYSRGTIRNNHYLGELTALTILSNFFKNKNVQELKKLLEKEIERQFYTDGVNFEQSIRYHKFSLEFALLAKIFLNINVANIGKSAEFLLATQKPNNQWPSIGDDDLGCVVRLNSVPLSDDYLDIINLSGLMINNEELLNGNNIISPLAEFFLPQIKDKLKNIKLQINPQKTFIFPKGGYFIHRTGWSEDDNYLLIKFGPHKWHAHADLFHLELSIKGIPILVDSGTFRYNDATQERKYFRSTAAHNTLEFNSSDQTKQFTNFRWHVPAKVIKWDVKEDDVKIIFSAIHDGYLKRYDVLHERNVSIDKDLNWIRVIDVIKGKGKGQAKIYWHFSPELEIKKMDESNIMVYKDTMEIVKICLSSKNIFKTRITETPYSPMYGVKKEQPTLVIEFEKKDSDIIQMISRFEEI